MLNTEGRLIVKPFSDTFLCEVFGSKDTQKLSWSQTRAQLFNPSSRKVGTKAEFCCLFFWVFFKCLEILFVSDWSL